jgi:thiamine biosynthesis lipoprotein
VISHAETVMGTVVSFLIDEGAHADEVVHQALGDACAELHRLDERFSAWKPESELSRLRRGVDELPSELMREVTELCEYVRDVSRGYFDPWVLPGGFDPTGLVKGWAAERALEILLAAGVTNALVNAGGDICVAPGRRYDVAIQHPDDPGAVCAVVGVDTAIATSGTYARGEHLHHPFGAAVASTSATVVGGRLAVADALATALAVGGVEVLYLLEQMPDVEGFFITPQGSLMKTTGMPLASFDVAQG